MVLESLIFQFWSFAVFNCCIIEGFVFTLHKGRLYKTLNKLSVISKLFLNLYFLKFLQSIKQNIFSSFDVTNSEPKIETSVDGERQLF